MKSKDTHPFLKRRVLYKGKRFSAFRDQIQWFNNKTIFKEWIKRPGICAVVTVLDKNHLILVRQYRYGANRFLWEVPAGTMNKGESPRKCAIRECEEETGFRAQKIKSLGSYYSIPALSNEKMYLFLATHLKKTQTNPDEDEKIQVKIFTVKQVKVMLKRGVICDAKSLIALDRYLYSHT